MRRIRATSDHLHPGTTDGASTAPHWLDSSREEYGWEYRLVSGTCSIPQFAAARVQDKAVRADATFGWWMNR